MRSLLTGLAVLLLLAVDAYANPAPRLFVDTPVASAGFYHLTWEAPPGDIELQEAGTGDFRKPRVFYRGPDRATVVSGKPGGTWYYRARAVDGERRGPWSQPLAVQVAHHSLSRAFTFLGMGVVVFLATVWLVASGPGARR